MTPGDQTREDEVQRLKACINSLIGIQQLPAIWTGGEPHHIIRALLDGLVRVLEVDFVYAEWKEPGAATPIQMIRHAFDKHPIIDVNEVSEVLNTWVTNVPRQSSLMMRQATGNISLAAWRMGLQDELGWVVAGSRNASFPTETEKLLLSVAANQAAIDLQEARLLGQQKRIATELDQQVAEQTRELQDVLLAQKKTEEALRVSEGLTRGQLDVLQEILGAISNEKNPDNLLQHVLRVITRQMGGQSVSVYSRNEDDSLTQEFVYKDGKIYVPEKTARLPLEDQPLYRECADSGTECLLAEYDRDPIWVRLMNRPGHSGVPLCDKNTIPSVLKRYSRLIKEGVVMSLGIPMVMRGRVSGFIGIRYNHHRDFLPEEIKLSLALAQQAALAMQVMRLSAESRQMAIASERNRMARDIHDTLAQGFTGIIAQLQAAKGPSDLKEATAHIERAENLARWSLEEARRSVRALRPRLLHATTLGTALETTLKTMASYSGLNIVFQEDGSQRAISPDWEEALLRIAQESLTNTIRHAGAQTFRSKLCFDAEFVRLELSDDGCGFDLQADREGFGLIGMKERVDQMGGEFLINSRPGNGTEIVISIPYLPRTESHEERDSDL